MDEITKSIFAMQDILEKIAKESYQNGILYGMKNCGHNLKDSDFLDNAQKAYEEEKDHKAMKNV